MKTPKKLVMSMPNLVTFFTLNSPPPPTPHIGIIDFPCGTQQWELLKVKAMGNLNWISCTLPTRPIDFKYVHVHAQCHVTVFTVVYLVVTFVCVYI